MSEISPEVRVFITALRAGKPSHQAFDEYCWAKSVVPIDVRDLDRIGDPFKCPTAWRSSMGEVMASDAFDEGADDVAIAEAFERGLDYDVERDVRFRPMKKGERPTSGELMRSLSSDDKYKVAELVGYAHAARMLVSR